MSEYRGLAYKISSTRIRSIGMIFIGVAIFHLLIVRLQLVHNFFYIQLVCALVVSVFCLISLNILINIKYIRVNSVLLLFAASAFVSSLVNKELSSSSIPDSIIFICGVIGIFVYCESLYKHNEVFIGLKTFFWSSIFYCLINDILTFIAPHRTVLDYGGVYYTYLVGTKFDVFYLHVFTIILLYVLYSNNGNKHRIILAISLIYTLAIALYDDCSTSLFGCLVLLVFYLFRSSLYQICKKPTIIFISIIVSDSLLLFNSIILQTPFAKYLIENVLHRNITLTGRTGIYNDMGALVSKSPFIGYGYENNLMISSKFLGAANTQNGVFDLLVSFGVIGVALISLLLVCSITQMRDNIEFGFITLLYFLIFISMVEISFRNIFFACLALIAFGQTKLTIMNSNR